MLLKINTANCLREIIKRMVDKCIMIYQGRTNICTFSNLNKAFYMRILEINHDLLTVNNCQSDSWVTPANPFYFSKCSSNYLMIRYS